MDIRVAIGGTQGCILVPVSAEGQDWLERRFPNSIREHGRPRLRDDDALYAMQQASTAGLVVEVSR